MASGILTENDRVKAYDPAFDIWDFGTVTSVLDDGRVTVKWDFGGPKFIDANLLTKVEDDNA